MAEKTIPIWHNFMSELTSLAHGHIKNQAWDIRSSIILVDFDYHRHRFRLLFCDNTAILATNGKLQYYEYADPDFTPNKVLEDIRRKHDHARNRY